MAQSLFFSLFSLLWLAGRVSADGGDDFANNLASDLGPIIALFGERVVMQFMSQSIGIADFILLAVAPIGAITVVVSAIRVAGPAWLKSFIGRARENTSAAEIEVMSSTSKEVCELWNGQSVVRCPGSADIRQLVCLIPKGCDVKKLSQSHISFRYKTLERAEDDSLLVETPITGSAFAWTFFNSLRRKMVKPYPNGRELDDGRSEMGSSTSQNTTSSPPGEIEITIVADTSDDNTPNLLLNCHDMVGRGEIRLAAVVGVILQLVALVYMGSITNQKSIRDQFLKDDKRAVNYAFPCAAVGTIMLVFGLFVCAWVVGKSTKETSYKAREHQIFLVWLQKGHTVSDQLFKPYAIYPIRKQNYITMSRRSIKRGRDTNQYRDSDKGQTWNRSLEFITSMGAFISLIGFISQFIGMRGLNWTASVVQLSITIVVTIIRTIVRRGLEKPPNYNALQSNSELDWLALGLGDLSNAPWVVLKGNGEDDLKSRNPCKWKILTGGEQAYPTLQKFEDQLECSTAHKIMVARQELGKLSGWKSPIFEEAERLSLAIELVAKTFLGGSTIDTYAWVIPATYETRAGNGKSSDEKIYIKLTNDNSEWKVDHGMIEAILSLWLYSTSSLEFSETDGRDSLRLYGPSRFKERLERDLEWWMPETFPKLCTANAAHINTSSTAVGFTKIKDVNESDEQFLTVKCQGTRERIFSRDLLFSFIRAVAKMPEFTMKRASSVSQLTNIKTTEGWKQIKLNNDDISRLAGKLEKIEFGTRSDIFFDLIVPLSLEQKLNNFKNIIDETKKQAQEYEMLLKWKELVDTCVSLLDLAQYFDPETESSGPLAIAVCLEFLNRLRHEAEFHESEGRDRRELKPYLATLEKKFEKFRESTTFSRSIILPADEWRYIASFNVLIKPALDSEMPFPDSFRITKEHEKVIEESKLKEVIDLRDLQGVGDTDIFGWSPLHYAVCVHFRRIYIGPSQIGEDLNRRDFMGWTLLQHACLNGNEMVVKMLLERNASIHIAGNDGITPMHCAVQSGNVNILRRLIEEISRRTGNLPNENKNVDRNKRYPIHWAAVKGGIAMVELLKDEINFTDRFGWTAAHLAVIYKHEQLLKYIIQDGEADINKGDIDFRTPLHLAVKFDSPNLVQELIAADAKVNVKAKDGSTPLHMAVKNESQALAHQLIEAGADLNAQTKDGLTPLHMAVKNESQALAHQLIEAGADLNAQTKDGLTPLHMAVKQQSLQLFDLLIEACADVDVQATGGLAPLHTAIEDQSREFAEKLMKANADVNAQTNNGVTPLHIAIEKQSLGLSILLLEKRAQVDIRAKGGLTLLHMAAKNNFISLASALCNAYADTSAKVNDVNAQARDGSTPLHMAVRHGNTDIVRILLKNDAEKEAKDSKGRTPLFLAAADGNFEVAALLIKAGANTGAAANDGRTPLDMARSYVEDGFEDGKRLFQVNRWLHLWLPTMSPSPHS